MDNILLVLLSAKLDRNLVIKEIEETGQIGQWFYSFPNSFFVTTNLNSKEMSKLIEQKFGEHMNFVSSIEHDYYGRMATDQWKHFKKVKY